MFMFLLTDYMPVCDLVDTYLYIWTVLWAVTMLCLNMPRKSQLLFIRLFAVCMGCYSALYAPAQALLFGLDFKGMISWIIAGLGRGSCGGNIVTGF